jgi:hypothetical protein
VLLQSIAPSAAEASTASSVASAAPTNKVQSIAAAATADIPSFIRLNPLLNRGSAP